ncbi:hypothetical protein AQUCO_03500030v1 [Aquilegia coerulea]|uniref:Uncharacterized protein n=1 Tax=Aquilegia coerulea TaxID=218851 RepID=A0A2G5CVN6_AQUCA|nr:hypothetical protein AQUCO_03500030v1 [Aquilegia coerulea]
MALFLSYPCSSVQLLNSTHFTTKLYPSSSCLSLSSKKSHRRVGEAFEVKACFFNPTEQPQLVKQALKEPVAFMGGVFAGLLRLDLNEDPLKDWLTRTVEATTSQEDVEEQDAQQQTPQQIQIE